MDLVNVSAGRDFTVDQRSFSKSVYQQSVPQQIMLSLGWGRSAQQRLLAAARRLATDVQAREATALARLVADTGHAQLAEVEFTQPPLLYWRTDGGAAGAACPRSRATTSSWAGVGWLCRARPGRVKPCWPLR